MNMCTSLSSGTVREAAIAAQSVSARLARATGADRDAALEAIADALAAGTQDILDANLRDLDAARTAGVSDAVLDRLRMDAGQIAGLAAMVREVAAMPSPLGETVSGSVLPSGLEVRQTRVPIGVIGMIYEGRPNVTVDAGALCLKSGNAVLLRGSSVARETNAALIEVMRGALTGTSIPVDAVQMVPGTTHASVQELMSLRGLVDIIVPRGGRRLIEAAVRGSLVPVIETGVGNCHIYVDREADIEVALRVLLNAKAQRPSVCNAAESLLVHADIADAFLPLALDALKARKVTVHGDARVCAYDSSVVPATDEDWGTEYLSLDISAAVVDSMEAAVNHIRLHGTGHTEAIMTDSQSTARAFVAAVDTAVVAVNASTRLVDGAEMGLGTELGISTQKLHVRGPMGLAAMTTTKYILTGDGHIRGDGSPAAGGGCEVLEDSGA
ncbi:glutamate-5-semialdehyde dehydrogenase [Streptomyces sp. ISL-96]|uniref:glutamate-5-semialdehyde dehydrogenase n=1 Tax=Streptomyces sp. ISL-96 TaxID=2819191 RepID=UPI001BE730D6|nr:glutamate-5-semialdehyde dehydrogenase [Streptomyces sp. ISL-96]MBT2493594.1 glutamate-5-semialdehyde dehydrogenase [Streptomyces sp. ISL-96]